MAIPTLTVEELIATLRKTNLPSIIVEGTSDVLICRRVEEMLGANVGNILFCEGRTALLEIYSRRNEIANIRIAFLADKDMWLFGSIPPEYADIVWSEGYCIENDCYTGSAIELLLTHAEKQAFETALDKVCSWFAFEVEEFLSGRSPHQATGIGHLLNDKRDALRAEFLTARGYRTPNNNLAQQIRNSYFLQLRGKTLFSLLCQFLSSKKREAKHSKSGLIEICVTMPRNPDLLTRIVEALHTKLNPQKLLAFDADVPPRQV